MRKYNEGNQNSYFFSPVQQDDTKLRAQSAPISTSTNNTSVETRSASCPLRTPVSFQTGSMMFAMSLELTGEDTNSLFSHLHKDTFSETLDEICGNTTTSQFQTASQPKQKNQTATHSVIDVPGFQWLRSEIDKGKEDESASAAPAADKKPNSGM